jgi:hypothetical protein
VNTRELRLVKNPAHSSVVSKVHEIIVTFVIVSGDIYWLLAIGGCVGIMVSLVALQGSFDGPILKGALVLMGAAVWMYLTNLAARFARARWLASTQLMPGAGGISTGMHLAVTCGLGLTGLCLLGLMLWLGNGVTSSNARLDKDWLLGFFVWAIIFKWAISQLPWIDRRPKASNLVYIGMLYLALGMVWANIDVRIGWGVMLVTSTLAMCAGLAWPEPTKGIQESANSLRGPASLRDLTKPGSPKILLPPMPANRSVAIQALRTTGLRYLDAIPIFVLMILLGTWMTTHFQVNWGFVLVFSLTPANISYREIFENFNTQPWPWTALLPVDKAKAARQNTLYVTWRIMYDWLLTIGFCTLAIGWTSGLDCWLMAIIPGCAFLFLTIAQIEPRIFSAHLNRDNYMGLMQFVAMVGVMMGSIWIDLFHPNSSADLAKAAMVNLICIGVAGLTLRLHWALWMTYTPTLRGPEFSVYKALPVFFRGSRIKQEPMKLPGASI